MAERVLVTGAGGFIGSRLVQRLLVQGYRVRVLLRDRIKEEHFRNLGCEVAIGDMTLFGKFDAATKASSLVFHLAVGGQDLNTARIINVDGTRELLRSARRNGVGRFIHTSSIAVLGDNLPSEVDEGFPRTEFGSVYQVSKAAGEKAALEYGNKNGIEVVVLRPTLVYGPGSVTWTLNPFYECKEERIVLIEGAWGIANLVYVDDMVEAFLLVARTRGIGGEIFHINGAERITWREYIRILCRMNRKPLPHSMSLKRARTYEFLSRWYTKLTGKPTRYHVDLSKVSFYTNKTYFPISKAERILGFVPRYNVQRGMVQTESWLRNQGYLPEQ